MKKSKKKTEELKHKSVSENKKTMNLAMLRAAVKRIDTVLFAKDFNGAENPLVTATAWTVQRNLLKDTSVTAKKVLDACCQPGRILDMIDRFEEFVSSINEKMNVEIVRAKGYCNYIFYVEEEMKKLSNGFTDLYEEKVLSVRFGRQQILDFISADCGKISGIPELISAKTQAEELLSKPKNEITAADIKKYDEILGVAENCEKIFASAAPQIKEIARSVSNQSEAMKQNIVRARNLHTHLTSKLTKEWFDSINYETEDCPLNQMDIPEIKQYLGMKIAEIKDVSLKH